MTPNDSQISKPREPTQQQKRHFNQGEETSNEGKEASLNPTRVVYTPDTQLPPLIDEAVRKAEAAADAALADYESGKK